MVIFNDKGYGFQSKYNRNYSSINPYHTGMDGFFTSIPSYSPMQNNRPSYSNNLENKVQYQGNINQSSNHLSQYANPRPYQGYRPPYTYQSGYNQRPPIYNR